MIGNHLTSSTLIFVSHFLICCLRNGSCESKYCICKIKRPIMKSLYCFKKNWHIHITNEMMFAPPLDHPATPTHHPFLPHKSVSFSGRSEKISFQCKAYQFYSCCSHHCSLSLVRLSLHLASWNITLFLKSDKWSAQGLEIIHQPFKLYNKMCGWLTYLFQLDQIVILF